MKRKLPSHIPGTHRAWKTRKRTEFRRALKAVCDWRLGCAYTPAGGFILELEKHLNEMRRLMSVKEWGR